MVTAGSGFNADVGMYALCAWALNQSPGATQRVSMINLMREWFPDRPPDGLEWFFKNRGVAAVYHYLDDFITIGHPESDECHRNMKLILDLCRILGDQVANKKCTDPSVCIIFLGIEID